MMPRSGEIVYVGKAASVQFDNGCDFLFRIIRVHDWATYEGWAWLDGYQLNTAGDAAHRRSIFVEVAGLKAVNTTPDPRARNGRRPTNQSPSIPTQRTSTRTSTAARSHR